MKGKARWILTILVLLVFAVYFVWNLPKFKPLLDINLFFLALIALGNIVAIISNGVFIRVILRPFGKFIGLAEAVYVSLISSVGNFFATAGAGVGFRAVYLKKRHNLPYSDYITTLYGNYVIVFLITSFFALLSLYLLREDQSGPYFALLTVFAGIFGVSLVLCLLRVPKVPTDKFIRNRYLNKLAKVLFRVVEGWNGIVTNKRLMLKLAGLITFNFVLSVTVSKLVISSLHLDISLPALLLFSVLGSLSIFVNITPANLGVKEVIYLFSGQVIGFSTEQILAIALVDRGVMFLTLAVMWLYSAKLKVAEKVS